MPDIHDPLAVAAHLLISRIFNTLGASDPKLASAIFRGIDEATSMAEDLVLAANTEVQREEARQILKIIKDFTTYTVGYRGKPDDVG